MDDVSTRLALDDIGGLPPMYGSWPDLPEPDLGDSPNLEVSVAVGSNRAVINLPPDTKEFTINVRHDSIRLVQRDRCTAG